MRVKVTEDKELENLIRKALKSKNNHCPCRIEETEDTLCMCKDFRENAKQGEYCHCGLYRKIEE